MTVNVDDQSCCIQISGTLAILAAQPTDVVKVRMQVAGGKKQYKVDLALIKSMLTLPINSGSCGCLLDY